MSAPVPAPGVVGKSIRWMTKRDGPLYVRPTLDLAFLRFMGDMLRHAKAEDFDRGLRRTLALNARTLALFDQMAAEGLQFEQHTRGILMVFKDDEDLEAHIRELAIARELGVGSFTLLTGPEARSEVPRLSRQVLGAIDLPTERFLDPDEYVDALAVACLARGVKIESGERVNSFEVDSRGVLRAAHGSRRWDADSFVIAAGAWSGQLFRSLGVRLPLQAGKGYGFDMVGSHQVGERGLYLSEAKVAITPLGGRTRLAGTMAFGGLDESVDPRRAGGILTSARAYLSGWPEATTAQAWSGLRPMTPDGLPMIGLVPGFENLVVATGHAMSGITLSPVTGSVVERVVMTGEAPEEALPFDPRRFMKGQ